MTGRLVFEIEQRRCGCFRFCGFLLVLMHTVFAPLRGGSLFSFQHWRLVVKGLDGGLIH
jgi:hypothetical protein